VTPIDREWRREDEIQVLAASAMKRQEETYERGLDWDAEKEAAVLASQITNLLFGEEQ